MVHRYVRIVERFVSTTRPQRHNRTKDEASCRKTAHAAGPNPRLGASVNKSAANWASVGVRGYFAVTNLQFRNCTSMYSLPSLRRFAA
jgi:hypothetical protein